MFAIAWLAYEPLVKAALGRRHMINLDMAVIRAGWMRSMAGRDNRLIDGQLLGHTINSASFFASSNLLLIAATSGVLFGGEAAFRSASSLILIQTSSRLLFEAQLALVLITLARGLLDFIWAIRQLNYTVAVVGAAPGDHWGPVQEAYGVAAGRLLNPALSAFNAGVRGYYFALAAASWIFGSTAFILATVSAVALLVWRQRSSAAARAIAELQQVLETAPPSAPARGPHDPSGAPPAG